jgi:hypothetical protein
VAVWHIHKSLQSAHHCKCHRSKSTENREVAPEVFEKPLECPRKNLAALCKEDIDRGPIVPDKDEIQ